MLSALVIVGARGSWIAQVATSGMGTLALPTEKKFVNRFCPLNRGISMDAQAPKPIMRTRAGGELRTGIVSPAFEHLMIGGGATLHLRGIEPEENSGHAQATAPLNTTHTTTGVKSHG
jgi:hypothetical protein